MAMYLWVALGGAVGAAGRYLVTTQTVRLLGHGFPWGTLAVNLLGSFTMGFLIELFALKFQVSQEIRAFLVTGILGGFTTFSAFSLDVAVLSERKAGGLAAIAYVFGSVGFSIAALFFGLWIVRTLHQ